MILCVVLTGNILLSSAFLGPSQVSRQQRGEDGCQQEAIGELRGEALASVDHCSERVQHVGGVHRVEIK